MSMLYNDKGKIYTDVIRKTAFRANIQTVQQRIEGTIHVANGKRVKDELDSDEHFIAVTDAKVIGKDGEMEFEADFMTVSRSQIVWLIPGESFEE